MQVMSTPLPAPLPAENSWGIIFRAIQVISGNNYLSHYLPNIFGNLICNSFGAHSTLFNSRFGFIRRPQSSYQTVVQGKCPLHFLNLNGVVCSNTLFSNTSALTSSLLFRGNSTCKILEHLVWSNTSGFQFWGPLARTNFLSALCGLPSLVWRAGTTPILKKKHSENLG